MQCTLCPKSASALAAHNLGSYCTAHTHVDTKEQIQQSETNCFPFNIKQEAELIIEDTLPTPTVEQREKILCGNCLEEFNEDDIHQHRGLCSPQLVFECLTCRELYVNREGLWDHLDHHKITEDLKENSFKETKVTVKLRSCVICNDHRGYPEKLYWEHVDEQHNGYYLHCFVCGKDFRSTQVKTAHFLNQCNLSDSKEEDIQDETISDQLPEKCPHCSERFHNMNRLNRHIISIHNSNRTSGTGSLQSKYVRKTSQSSPRCTTKFHSSTVFRRHLRSHGGTEKPHEGIILKIEKPGEDEAMLVEKKIQGEANSIQLTKKCPHCSERFDNFKILNTHIASIHNSKGSIGVDSSQNKTNQLSCPRCTAKFKTSAAQRRHLKLHGEVEMPPEGQVMNIEKPGEHHADKAMLAENGVQCPHCNNLYKGKSQLRSHIVGVHNPKVCNICGITLVGKDRMKYHKRKEHKGSKHSCPHCPMKFLQPYNLRRHLETHDEEAE